MLGLIIAVVFLFMIISIMVDALSQQTYSQQAYVQSISVNPIIQELQECSIVLLKRYLEALSVQANDEDTEVICKYSDIRDIATVADVEKVSPEIEQKYDVTILPYYDGFHIRPNSNYKNEYWS